MPPSPKEIQSIKPALTVSYQYGNNPSSFAQAKVDILIPFHGQYTKVRNLVESILLHTLDCPYLITLIDDGSPNKTFVNEIQKHAPVYCLQLSEQKGFACAVNAGVSKTVNPWIVVLHSDCIMKQKHWLRHLGESMMALKDQGVKYVHARTDNPVMDNPYLVNSTVNDRGNDTVVVEDEPLPMICAMFNRELFKRIGELKEYPYAGYENVEFFHRMKRNKYKQAVSGVCWVSHEGGGTINHLDRKTIKLMENNYDSCVADIMKLQ